MSTNEINTLGRGAETYNLHLSCAFFAKVDYFRFAPRIANTLVRALAHEAEPRRVTA
jgi:hypothetical protein